MAQKKVLVLDKDKVQITPATDETVILLRRIAKLLEPSSVCASTANTNTLSDLSLKQRVIAEQQTAANLNVTVGSGTITTVTTVTQIANISTANGPVDLKYLLMDTARNAYANGIRKNLSW